MMSEQQSPRRNYNTIVVGTHDGCVFIDGSEVRTASGLDADLLSQVLASAATPDGEILLTEILDEETIQALIEAKVLTTGAPSTTAPDTGPNKADEDTTSRRRVVVGITGAIGVAEIAPTLGLVKRTFGDQLDVVVSNAAHNLIQPNGLRHLDMTVWSDPFEIRGDINVPHMHLATSADIVLIIPASAHTIHKLATGECADLISLVVAATEAPVVVVPAMNHRMWTHAPIMRNVAQLRNDGMYVVEPGLGREVSSGSKGEPLGLGGTGVIGEQVPNLLKTILHIVTEAP